MVLAAAAASHGAQRRISTCRFALASCRSCCTAPGSPQQVACNPDDDGECGTSNDAASGGGRSSHPSHSLRHTHHLPLPYITRIPPRVLSQISKSTQRPKPPSQSNKRLRNQPLDLHQQIEVTFRPLAAAPCSTNMTLEDVTVWIRDDAVVAANGGALRAGGFRPFLSAPLFWSNEAALIQVQQATETPTPDPSFPHSLLPRRHKAATAARARQQPQQHAPVLPRLAARAGDCARCGVPLHRPRIRLHKVRRVLPGHRQRRPR